MPSPLPRNTLTVSSIRLAVTMSGMPSPFKSPTATESVPAPEAKRGKGQTGLGERRGEPVSPRTRLLRDGQQVRPRLQRLDDLTAVRLDQHLARRSGQRQPRLQRAAGGGDLRLQLPVAQRAADRERPGAHLARAQRAR